MLVPGQGADPISALARVVSECRPLFVLTGAGCSTASGIPNYRERDGNWKLGQPIRYQEFLRSAAARRRYWSRSFIGWPQVAAALPNGTHRRLPELEAAGYLHQLVTQNVDGLHQLAGHRRVIDLHGRLAWVDCLACRHRPLRAEVQQRLHEANPDFRSAREQVAPDGDAMLEAAPEQGFRVPDCPACGGLLKPAVVFFGENVPRARVDRAYERVGNQTRENAPLRLQAPVTAQETVYRSSAAPPAEKGRAGCRASDSSLPVDLGWRPLNLGRGKTVRLRWGWDEGPVLRGSCSAKPDLFGKRIVLVSTRAPAQIFPLFRDHSAHSGPGKESARTNSLTYPRVVAAAGAEHGGRLYAVQEIESELKVAVSLHTARRVCLCAASLPPKRVPWSASRSRWVEIAGQQPCVSLFAAILGYSGRCSERRRLGSPLPQSSTP
jgi:NAD-dependent SIR2 family protein deacetylase